MAATEAEKAALFDELATLDPNLFLDNATFFTCQEANTIAKFVTAAHSSDMAFRFLSRHTIGDDDKEIHIEDGSLRGTVS